MHLGGVTCGDALRVILAPSIWAFLICSIRGVGMRPRVGPTRLMNIGSFPEISSHRARNPRKWASQWQKIRLFLLDGASYLKSVSGWCIKPPTCFNLDQTTAVACSVVCQTKQPISCSATAGGVSRCTHSSVHLPTLVLPLVLSVCCWTSLTSKPHSFVCTPVIRSCTWRGKSSDLAPSLLLGKEVAKIDGIHSPTRSCFPSH